MAEGFGDVQQFIGGCDVADVDADGLATMLADVRTTQRMLDGLVVRIGERADLLATQGQGAPAAETMRAAGAVGARQARHEAKRAALASAIPALGEALSAGVISAAHLDAVAAATNDLTADELSQLDAAHLVERATALPVETYRRLVGRLVESMAAAAATEPSDGEDPATPQDVCRFRHWFDDDTATGHFSGSLDAESYEVVVNAIEQHAARLAAASDQRVQRGPNLAARALVDLLSGDRSGQSKRRLPTVNVMVDHDTLVSGDHPNSIRRTENGRDLSTDALARLCCDAVLRKVVLDADGVPINAGRKYRTATDAQWAALKAIHHTCAWEGCTAPISWCQAHHIKEWEHGGLTDLDNLVPLCSRHHHFVHEGGWTIKLLPDRTLEIFRPDGRHHTTVLPPLRC
jgi:hypothetical protein